MSKYLETETSQFESTIGETLLNSYNDATANYLKDIINATISFSLEIVSTTENLSALKWSHLTIASFSSHLRSACPLAAPFTPLAWSTQIFHLLAESFTIGTSARMKDLTRIWSHWGVSTHSSFSFQVSVTLDDRSRAVFNTSGTISDE